MAGVAVHFPTDEISLSAATAKTVMQIIAATNQSFKLKTLEIFGKGIVATDTPMKVRLLLQTTAIGGTPAAVTGVKNDGNCGATVQTTAKAYGSSPAEPTPGGVFKVLEVHPQTGLVYPFAPSDEIIVAGGTRLGIEVTAAQPQTVAVNVVIEE